MLAIIIIVIIINVIIIVIIAIILQYGYVIHTSILFVIGECKDNIDDCDSYGDICNGNYKTWAEQNCAKYCGVGNCKVITTPPRKLIASILKHYKVTISIGGYINSKT